MAASSEKKDGSSKDCKPAAVLYQDYAYGKRGDPYAKDRIRKLRRLIVREACGLVEAGHKEVKILDIGCGDGFLLEQLRDDVKQIPKDRGAIEFCGADVSMEAVEKCRARGFLCRQSDAGVEIPYDSSLFDIVFATEVIEHLVDTDRFMAEVRRITREDGCLLLTTPNLAAWFNRLLLLIGLQPIHTEVSFLESYFGRRFLYRILDREAPKPVGHLRMFTYRGLLDFLRYSGFEVRQAIGYYYHPIPGNRLLSNLFPGLADGVIVNSRKET